MTIKRSGNLTTSELDLTVEGKIQDHHRKQLILDAATIVARYTIFIFPIGLGLTILIFTIHEVFIKGNWSFLLTALKYCIAIFLSYLGGILSKNGITPRE